MIGYLFISLRPEIIMVTDIHQKQQFIHYCVREMRVRNPNYPNFFQKDDPDFTRFHNTLDNLFKQLRKDGIGAEVSTTEEITRKSTGVLNVETPAGLLNSIFYYCGKCFCLRGGQERRTLSLSQFERKLNPDRYVYTENSSKNKQGGIKQMRLDHKVVTIVANPKIGERCPVVDKYISKLPTKAKEMNIFYCRICPRLPKTSEDR